VHLATGSYFWSCNKDGGHAVRSAIGENPMLYAHFTALCVIDTELLPMEFSHCGAADLCRPAGFRCGILDGCQPLLLLWPRPWPSFTNLTRTPWRYTGCANMNFPHQGFWKLSSWQTDRIDRNYKPCRFAGGP